MVRDARGRCVLAVSVKDIARTDGVERDQRRRDVLAIMRKLDREAAWAIGGSNFMSIWIIVFLSTRLESRIIGRQTFQGWPRLATIVFLIAGFAAICIWLARGRAARRRADAAVEANFCGSCGYDLQGFAPAPNTVRQVTCPECGSTWKLWRISIAPSKLADTISP